jgi:signal peptidase I
VEEGTQPDLAGQRHPRLRTIFSWVLIILVASVVATGTRAYAAQSFFVPSGSMAPTLIPGDHIIVDKLAGTIHRGDIVVFHNVPADVGGPPTLVKRVIGLPGELISGNGDQVFIDGKVLRQPWLPHLTGICASLVKAITPTRIPANSYFAMGDCRGDSDDSRYWGTVPGSNIVGKVEAIVWRQGHPWFSWF